MNYPKTFAGLVVCIGIGALGCGSSGTGSGTATGGTSSGGTSSGGTGGAPSGGSGGTPSGGTGGTEIGGSGGGPAGGGGTSSGGQAGASGSGGAPTCGCASGEGCLRSKVTRSADTSLQPWTVWPSEADGQGTLVVSAVDGSNVVNRVTLPNADMTPASATYEVDLGCVPATTLTVTVFLDDNENSPSDAWFSSDYRDSCMLDRFPKFGIQANAVNTFDLVLNNSCD